jgi:hypothetical protein
MRVLVLNWLSWGVGVDGEKGPESMGGTIPMGKKNINSLCLVTILVGVYTKMIVLPIILCMIYDYAANSILCFLIQRGKPKPRHTIDAGNVMRTIIAGWYAFRFVTTTMNLAVDMFSE